MLSKRFWFAPMIVAAMLGGAPAHAGTVRVTIDKLVFAPAVVKARVGDTIEWNNTDFVAHTATDKNGAFDVDMDPGKTGRVTVSKAGTIQYFCQYHPDMVGTITVLPK